MDVRLTRRRNERKRVTLIGIATNLAAVCLIVPALFNDILPNDIRNDLMFFGCLIALALFLRHRSFDLLSIGVGFGWFAFAIFAILDRMLTGGSLGFRQIAFPLAAMAACLSTCSTSWIRVALRWLTILLCVHLIATLIFYFVPSLYTATVKNAFFSGERNAIGYQSGLTSHYSNNGFLMAIGFLLAGCMCMGSANNNKKACWGCLSASFLFALILTQKRSDLIFSALALLLVFSLSNLKGKSLKIVVLLLVTVAAGFFAASTIPGIAESFNRFSSTLESNDMTEVTTGRTYLWAVALRGWNESFWIGNGWGSFLYTWPGGNVSIYAHNEILQLLNDTGVVGTGVFVILSCATFKLAYVCVKKDDGRESSSHATLKSASYFAFAAEFFIVSYACTTGTMLQMPMIYILFFVALGIDLSLRYERHGIVRTQRRSLSVF